MRLRSIPMSGSRFKVPFTRQKIAIAAAAILAVTAAASSAPAARGPAIKVGSPAISHGFKPDAAPVGYDCTTGTSAPYYCLGAENESAQNGFADGVYGLEGYAPNATGGVGVLGYSGNSTVSNAYGVYGVTFSPSGIGIYGAGDGPTPAPADTPSNTTESTGVVGDSHAGDGVYGSTEWPGKDPAGKIAGVVGVDNSTSGEYNVGVLGTSSSGAYGVYGLVEDGAIAGVGGYAPDQVGVHGQSGTGYGVQGISGSGYGVYGVTTSGAAGVLGISSLAGVSGTSNGNGSGGDGVVGTSQYSGGSCSGGCIGVSGMSTEGDGVYASSVNSDGLFANSTNSHGAVIENHASNADTLDVFQEVAGANPLFIQGASANLLRVDSNGNLSIKGTLATSASFVRTRNPNSDLMSYGAQVAEPTMEDVGSAQLVNGAASVSLGADFRQTIDGSSRYMVFLTPYGENHGLYVASRTPDGFVVRESYGGRSTMAFDYRIVAKQYGAREGRLPRASLVRATAGFDSRSDVRDDGRPSASAMAKLAVAATKPKVSAKAAAFFQSVQNRTAFRDRRFTPRANTLVERRLR